MAAQRRSSGTGLFRASIVLGRVGGIEIGLNWSWAIVFALIAVSLGAAVFPEENPGLSDGAYVAMAAAATVLFFVSLVLHELGHALQARREGMEIEGITLWLFGGVARFKGMFPSAGAELRIALAGPLVSLLLGALFVALALLLSLPDAVDGVVAWLGRINLILLAFNMLPALPLDGGRVLRALLWRSTGDFTRATRTAGGIGRGAGQAMVAGGVVLFLLGAPGGLWFVLLGWFLAAAASAETRFAELREILRGDTVADAMAARPVVADADLTLDRFMDDLYARHRYAAYPVIDGGRLAGIVTFRAAAQVPIARWPVTRVRDVAVPIDDAFVVAPSTPLGEVAAELPEANGSRGLVAEDGELRGLLSITDVARLLELRRLEARR